MGKIVEINPITRLEGHGRILIFLDEEGNVERAYFQIPELRGFEKFAVGRPAELMPQLTARICGVCSWAHHMASSKALDDLFKVEPPPTAKKIREMVYNAFMLEDHLFHFYILAGPDFIVGPKAPKEERNIIGTVKKLGAEVVKKIVSMRKQLREVEALIGGKPIHPVMGLPGGISKPITEEEREKIVKVARESVVFAKFTYDILKKAVVENERIFDLVKSEEFTHRTYYMGLVDEKNRLNFYEGKVRVIDPRGREFAKFDAHEYREHLAEHVEPWTYAKFIYLKKIGWRGFVDGEDSGILCVGPLARLNVADGMETPLAQEAYEEMYGMLGGKPVHHTLAMHWARVIEMIYAAERFRELAEDPEITSPEVRNVPREVPTLGIGVVEAPRGTLIHHYETDEKGTLKKVNLIVATQNNIARICLSIDKAAKALVKGGVVDEGILNMVEMAFRAYDPCHACATHSAPGRIPLVVEVYDSEKKLIKVLRN